jgi:hypothetical protein
MLGTPTRRAPALLDFLRRTESDFPYLVLHKAEIRDIGGIVYCNDGDWVESQTTLMETAAGDLEILHRRDRAVRLAMVDVDELDGGDFRCAS